MPSLDSAVKWISAGLAILAVISLLFGAYVRVENIGQEIDDIHVKVEANDELQQAWRNDEDSEDLSRYRNDVQSSLAALDARLVAIETLHVEHIKQREDRFEELEQEHKLTRAQLSDIRRDLGVLLGKTTTEDRQP